MATKGVKAGALQQVGAQEVAGHHQRGAGLQGERAWAEQGCMGYTGWQVPRRSHIMGVTLEALCSRGDWE